MGYWWCNTCLRLFVKKDNFKKHIKRQSCIKLNEATRLNEIREMAKTILESMEGFVSGLIVADSSEIVIAEKLNASSYVTELKKNHNASWYLFICQISFVI